MEYLRLGIDINPGAGPVEGASEAHAEINMRHLLVDCAAKDLKFVRVPEHDKAKGRYSYLVYRETRCHLVEMPGLPLEQVRYSGDGPEGRNFPRLFVDGASWWWKFALSKLDEKAFAEPEY
jgi:hypothetical protein